MQGQELRRIRQEIGWTQAQLAGALGITETYVGLMERGAHVIERRTELAVQQLHAHRDARDLDDLQSPISEAENMLQAIENARDAVHSYRRSKENLSVVAMPSMRLTILQLAEELKKLLIESEPFSPELGPSHGG